MPVIAKIGYRVYRTCRILMRGGDRRVLGTEGTQSDMPKTTAYTRRQELTSIEI